MPVFYVIKRDYRGKILNILLDIYFSYLKMKADILNYEMLKIQGEDNLIILRYLCIWAERILCMILLLLFIFLLCLTAHQEANGGETPAFRDYKLMIVMSGSMKPAFDTGAMIAVKTIDPGIIKTGDIITYRDVEDAGRLITHRVAEIVFENDEIFFITKGDDNVNRDFSLVPAQNVIGKVTGALPCIGYLAVFSASRVWMPMLLIFPVVFAVIGGYRAVRQIFGSKESFFMEEK